MVNDLAGGSRRRRVRRSGPTHFAAGESVLLREAFTRVRAGAEANYQIEGRCSAGRELRRTAAAESEPGGRRSARSFGATGLSPPAMTA